MIFNSHPFDKDLPRLKALLGDIAPEKSTPGQKIDKKSSGSSSPIAGKIFRDELFHLAGVELTVRSKYLSLLGATLLLALFGHVSTGSAAFWAIPFLTYLAQKHTLQSKIQARQSEFDRDYAALLLSLSSGVKTGLDPLMALSRSTELFQTGSVMQEELLAFQTALNEGKTEDEAIDIFGTSVKHPDIKLFRMAFKLARKEGAALSVCLQRLARVTRQRQSFRRKTRGAVAMQKLSAFGIAGCCVLIGFIQGLSNLQAFLEALSHPFGRVAFGLSFTLIISGIWWMLNMTKVRV